MPLTLPHFIRYANNDWIANFSSILKSRILRRVASHLVANTLFAVLIYSLYVQVCVCRVCDRIYYVSSSY